MENNNLSKYTVSFGLALAIGSVANALLVVAKEKSRAIQSEMQKLTGSHWTTHVVLVLILFFGIGFLFQNLKSGSCIAMPVNRLVRIILGGIIAGGAVIIGFYLLAD